MGISALSALEQQWDMLDARKKGTIATWKAVLALPSILKEAGDLLTKTAASCTGFRKACKRHCQLCMHHHGGARAGASESKAKVAFNDD